MNSRTLSTFIVALLALVITGCGQQEQNRAGATSTPSDSPSLAADSQKGGAQLWAENCSRCHNSRPPQSFSDAQWQAVVMHMRLRADLTGPETRKITEFLQASH
jgi:cytochrome c5